MTEKEFQKLVEERCNAHKLSFIHISRIDPKTKGFPDLFICGSHQIMFAELKLPGNKPAGEQARWLHKLRGAGQTVRVWNPTDLMTGLIDAQLAALNQPR